MEDEVIITYHGEQRGKDRLGLSKNLIDKKAKEALEYGIGQSDAKGHLARYMASLYFYNKSANNLRIYHRKVYVFRDSTLITILNLPNNLSAAADKIQKRKREVMEGKHHE